MRDVRPLAMMLRGVHLNNVGECYLDFLSESLIFDTAAPYSAPLLDFELRESW
jgi:hypothetical protein